jgi:hypothetical protein
MAPTQSTTATSAAGPTPDPRNQPWQTGAAGTGQASPQSTVVGTTGRAETTQGGVGGTTTGGTGAGQTTTAQGAQLATTGRGPVIPETLLGALVALIDVALLKPKEVFRRFTR